MLVSLDERLLRRVDAEAKARGVSRSRLLSELADRGLPPRERPAEEQREIQEAIERLRELAARMPKPDEPAEVTIRRMRDERADRSSGG